MNKFNELELFATPLKGLGLIEASAGTGKTWTITGLYVRLIVEQGYKAEQILVVTYTKAATAELRERIRRRLAEALTAFETGQAADAFCRQLLENAEDSGQNELASRRLKTALRNFDEAAIFTIHGFCQRVLTESAFESGMEFETELTPDESAIVMEIVDDFWRRETAQASPLWIKHLAERGQTPDAWRKAVQPHLGKPYLELAPSQASADTKLPEQDLTERFEAVGKLWREHREEITGIVLKSTVAKTLKNTIYKPDTLPSWFESFDDYFLEAEPGLETPEKLIKLTKQELEKGTAKNQQTPEHVFFDACPALIDAAAELAEQFRLKLIDLQIRLIDHCNDELPRRKTRLGLLSYNDLLNRLHQALQAGTGGRLAAAIRERYRAALIDEFQDTDPVQYAIFQAIYVSGEQPVFFVGDPKQAIYGFRGADVFSYLQARDQAQAHYTLAVNQRSCPELIAAVNALFLRTPNPFLFDDIGYPRVKAADKSRPKLEIEGDEQVPFRFVLAPGDGKPLNKEEANRLSAQFTATEIVRLLNLSTQGKAGLVEPSETGGHRPLGGGDIAVLVPTHRQGELVQIALAARGVPAVRQGQDNVFASNEACELERILLAIAEPQRESLIKSALATTLTGLDAAAIFALQNDETAWERVLAGLARYREIWLERGFMPMFRRWLEEIGVIERLLAYRDGERRLTNLLHLAELLQVASRDKAGPDELLGWLSRNRSNPEGDEETLLRLESDAERVKIVTIHTSKGLEYPIVFCPFLWDGNLWRKDETAASYHDPAHDNHAVLDLAGAHDETCRNLASKEKLAEKLRLLYVALTRAKHRCYAVWGHFREMETSALAWLLHGPAEPGEDPLSFMAATIKGLGAAAIEQSLLDFAAQTPAAVAVESLIIDETRYVPSPPLKQNLQTLAFNRPYLRPSWRMTSFSALSQGRHSEGPDYDPILGESEETAPERSIFAFPRGAGAGRCLHAIFEEWDFGSPDGVALERLVRRKLKAHAIDEDWVPTVATMVQAVLNADLNGSGLRLVDINADDRLAEMEFTYPLGELESGGLKRRLMDPDLGLPVEFARAAEGLSFETVKGYMKGFIDLGFEAGGRFYLLDYKSNWLGTGPRHYTYPCLLQAMAREHYYLQYLIYCLALHRYLGLRLAGYDYEAHFGGVFYLFLRGIGHPGAPDGGLFRDRPRRELIEALDEFLSSQVTPRV